MPAINQCIINQSIIQSLTHSITAALVAESLQQDYL